MSRQLRSGKTVITSTIVPKRVYNKTVKQIETEIVEKTATVTEQIEVAAIETSMGSLRLDESNTASFILADASVLSSNSENNKRNEMEEDDVLDASLATEPKAKSSFYSDILFIYSLY